MSTANISAFEEAVRQSGEGWIIDWYAPKDQAMNHLRGLLAEAEERAKKRECGDAPSLSEEAIIAECRRNPRKMRAFFQALGGTRTPDMLLMVWRIIQGMEIKDIRLAYQRQETFEMRVVLQSPYGEQDAPYVSSNIHDFALLRQIGVHEINGRPVFDGFYALKVREAGP